LTTFCPATAIRWEPALLIGLSIKFMAAVDHQGPKTPQSQYQLGRFVPQSAT
jgi:hypothetical protein